MGGVFVLFRGGKLNNKKITKINYDKGLRWPPFDILHATTNQKTRGHDEGGWGRPCNHSRTIGEQDGNNKPLVEDDGNDDKDDEYDEDGDIPNDDDEYAVGLTVSMSPSTRTTTNMLLASTVSARPLTNVTTSAAPVRACPVSQRPSVPSR